jgi:hypothetical protein
MGPEPYICRAKGCAAAKNFKPHSIEILGHLENRQAVNGSSAIKMREKKVILGSIRLGASLLSLNRYATFLATSRIVARMMSGEECRAKARQSLDFAKQAPGDQLRAEWRLVARDWLRLSRMADYQDRMPCE